MHIFWILLIFLGGMSVLVFAFLLYAYHTAFYSAPRKVIVDGLVLPDDPMYDSSRQSFENMKAIIRATAHEEVFVTSFDGLRLVGKYYERSPGAPLHIVFHGYRSGPVGDSAGGFHITETLGHNLLTVYQRASGLSEGHTITFGVLESKDVLTWVTYACERFGNVPIFLHGISMGASTVLTAAGLDLPSSVVGIIADCGFTSAKDILCSVVKSMHFPVKVTYAALRLSAKLFGHFDPEATSAVEGVKKARVPVMLAHGESDTFVPFAMVHQLYDACAAEKHLLTVAGAAHGMSYLTETERYEREACAFISRYLARFEKDPLTASEQT